MHDLMQISLDSQDILIKYLTFLVFHWPLNYFPDFSKVCRVSRTIAHADDSAIVTSKSWLQNKIYWVTDMLLNEWRTSYKKMKGQFPHLPSILISRSNRKSQIYLNSNIIFEFKTTFHDMKPPAINPLECTTFVYGLPNQFKSIGFPYTEFLNPSDLTGCNT